MIQTHNYLECVCGTVCTNMIKPEQIEDFWEAHEECYTLDKKDPKLYN